MAYDWLNARTIRPTPKSFYKPAPKTVKKPPVIKPGDRRPNQYTDTDGENVPTFYNPTRADGNKPNNIVYKPTYNQRDIKPHPIDLPQFGEGMRDIPYVPTGKETKFINPTLPKDNRNWWQRMTDTSGVSGGMGVSEQPKTKETAPPSRINNWWYADLSMKDYLETIDPDKFVMQSDNPREAADWINSSYAAYKKANQEALDFWKKTAYDPYASKNPEPEGVKADSFYGARFVEDRGLEMAGKPPVEYDFYNRYVKQIETNQKIVKANKIEQALEQAAPLFTPLLDENGEVLAPALMTPEEYTGGIEDGIIYDPNMPDSKFRFGKTELVYQDGKIMPAEEWYRTVGDHLIGGNWELPEFTDQGGYQYNSRQNWANPSMAIGLENKSLQNAMNDAKITGNQFINPNFYPHINYQLYDQVVAGNEQVEDSYGEDDGDYGYGDGYGYGYGYGYGGSSGGYGPNYYNDAYRQNKGQYYSQLARWVI